MKRAIITILSLFLGLFGYQSADKMIEARIEKFEQDVSSVQQAVSSQQAEIKSAFIEMVLCNNSTSADTTSSATTHIRRTTTRRQTTGTTTPETNLNGYKYSEDGYYYCDDRDCWQKNTGYNEVYDRWAPRAAMFIDQVRIRFPYEGKNWMIQMWKGQYGFTLIGAETGIFTCDIDEYKGDTTDTVRFCCADREDWLRMQLDCYYSEGGKGPYDKIFTRPYDTYWWTTGFVKGQLTKYTAPRTELKTINRITFKSEEQANLFVQGLEMSGFIKAPSVDTLFNDSYYASGADVWVLWYAINHDCFIGYSESGATAKQDDSTGTTKQSDTTATTKQGDTTATTKQGDTTSTRAPSSTQAPSTTQASSSTQAASTTTVEVTPPPMGTTGAN
jgi:hypothetical protein